MDRKTEIIKMRTEMDYNCAQAALCALEDLTGLSRDTAVAITDGFGGGIRCGEVCGAVTGAVMAIGIMCREEGDKNPRNAKVSALTKKLTEKFIEENGCLACRDLKASPKHTDCNKYIIDAVKIVEELIKE